MLFCTFSGNVGVMQHAGVHDELEETGSLDLCNDSDANKIISSILTYNHARFSFLPHDDISGIIMGVWKEM